MSAKVSILMPVYNESDLIGPALERVLAADLRGVETEIVAVDDGSSDDSVEVLERFARAHPGRIVLVRHPENRGKGAAIHTAIANATGEFAIIQDSDLEYNPQDMPLVLRPLLEGRADAVFGSRFLVAGERRVLYFWHALANKILTTLCNIAADLNLTDMETGYKAFRLSLVKSIPLRSERFGLEPELTIKLAQRGAALYEVPISYRGRTYEEGKKIGLRDALEAVWLIVRYGIQRDIYLDPGARILDALARTPHFNRWMADTIRPYVGRRVLEIGAGIGNLTNHLSSKRERYTATDIEDEHLERLRVRFQGRPNIVVRHCDLQEPRDFAGLEESADTVICLNVLEHVADEMSSLRNIRDALAPGGRAIVLVPQGEAVYGTLDEVLGHYRRYSEPQLRSRLEAAGFGVERILHFNRATLPGWFVNGRILKRRHFSRLQLWVFDRLVWLWKRADAFLPWPAVSLIAIARRPDRA